MEAVADGGATREEVTVVDSVMQSVKRVCGAGLDSVRLRHEVAARLAPAIGFDAHVFSTCDPETGLISHTVSRGMSFALARTCVERIHPELCEPFATDALRDGRGAGGLRELSRPVRALRAALGTDSLLHVSLTDGARLWGTWCLLRHRGADERALRERSLLTRLVPDLVRGLQAAALVGGEPALAEPTAGAEPGVVVLDARNRAMMRTPAAVAGLADLADVGLRTPDGVPLAVLALVARARAAGADSRGEAHLRARGRSGRWYLLRASLAEPDALTERAAVVIVRPATSREVASILTRRYALSARECEVISAVARGESTKEIAAAFGLSPHTIIEHIERACRKLGVRGRKALVAKLFIDGEPRGLVGLTA